MTLGENRAAAVDRVRATAAARYRGAHIGTGLRPEEAALLGLLRSRRIRRGLAERE